jgi:hypothetical protein
MKIEKDGIEYNCVPMDLVEQKTDDAKVIVFDSEIYIGFPVNQPKVLTLEDCAGGGWFVIRPIMGNAREDGYPKKEIAECN